MHRVLVCSGSVPPGAPTTATARLVARAHARRRAGDRRRRRRRSSPRRSPPQPDLVTPNLAEAEGLLHGRVDESVEASPDAQPRAEAAALAARRGGCRDGDRDRRGGRRRARHRRPGDLARRAARRARPQPDRRRRRPHRGGRRRRSRTGSTSSRPRAAVSRPPPPASRRRAPATSTPRGWPSCSSPAVERELLDVACSVMATAAIEISGLVKTFGAHARARRARPDRRRPARSTASSDPTAPASRPRSASCSGCCAPTPATSACSAATRGRTPSRCTAGSPTCPATSTCGRTSPAARRSTCSGALRGGLDPARRADLLERFDLDPTKKAPHLLQGQPPEGRADRRARVERRAADPRRADVGAGPADGGGVPGLHPTSCKAEGRTVLLSSHILAEVEALCDRVSIIRAGRTVETGTLDELRHLTRTSIIVETAQPPQGLDRLAGVHDLQIDGHAAPSSVDTAQLDAALRSSRGSACAAS